MGFPFEGLYDIHAPSPFPCLRQALHYKIRQRLYEVNDTVLNPCSVLLCRIYTRRNILNFKEYHDDIRNIN